MAKLRTRRLLSKGVESGNVEEKEKLVYCRKCMENKRSKEFHSAVNLDLDKNLLMSVCKSCVNEIFENFLIISGNNLNDAIYKTCRMLDVMYLESVVDSLKLHLTKIGEKGNSPEIFGLYKSHLGRWVSLNKGVPATFNENKNVFVKDENNDQLIDETEENKEYLIQMWGDGFSKNDYSFLENELAEWKGSHSSNSHGEIVLLKEICYVQLDLRNSRTGTVKDTSSSLKKLIDAMKAGGFDPAKASQANSGTNKETWGVFLKAIEETTPAEYFKDKNLYKDFDNQDVYFQNYIRRPAINFYSSTHNLELLEMSEDKRNEDVESLDIKIEGE